MNLKELFTWRRPWSIPINRIDQAILGYESDEEIRINYYGSTRRLSTSNFHLRGWKPYKLAHVPLSMVEQNLIRFDMQFWWPLRWPSLRSFGSQTNRRQKPKHPNFRYKWRHVSKLMRIYCIDKNGAGLWDHTMNPNSVPLSVDSGSCPCVPVHLFTTKGVAFGWTTEGRRSIGTWLTAYKREAALQRAIKPTGMGGVGSGCPKKECGKR